MEDTTPSNSDSEEKSLVTPEGGGAQDDDGDWVKHTTENDVLCGRGGSINSHPGNERFRTLVERRKRVYLTARFKREKRLIANSIVSDIRALNPSGRFLTRDAKTQRWKDIGDEKARDKTSQALRENAPTIRAEIETEIKEQRAEMQRAEEEEAAAGGGAQPPSYQYWGYPSYYGYNGCHPPPPPQSPHGHPPPPGYYERHWGPYPPPPPYSGHESPYAESPPPQPSPAPKSTLEHTTEMVASGADSIKSYFDFGGGGSTSGGGSAVAMKTSSSSNDCHGANVSRAESAASAHSKPILYVHGTKRRRMVKFRDDTHGEGRQQHQQQQQRSRRPTYSPVQGASVASNSLADYPEEEEEEDVEDIEPENIDAVGEQNSSLMAQVANHILSSIGSWDASTIVCGHDGNADDRITFPEGHAPEAAGEDMMEQAPEENMTVEWEGQEVLLMNEDLNSNNTDRESSPERMPPPVARRPFGADTAASSIGFSSVGSCHSWLLPDAASIFRGSRGGGEGEGGMSPVASMEMEYNSTGGGGGFANNENYSMGGSIGGSIGGNSLTRVFENEVLDEIDPAPVSMGSPSMSNRVLLQVPSWERSLRSKSPLSLGSDDGSLMSNTSSKEVFKSGISPSPEDDHGDDGMVWETRE